MNKAGPNSKCIWPEDRERIIRKLYANLDALQGAQYGATITTTITTRLKDSGNQKENSLGKDAC